ncbi:DUF4268 domain-containing protein [Candidatus Collinsella stercoripullorum]|uniref:DUF4268 domain-containing protein n=1 Tax=Candidatus Collinsella stercoripullorum TaxID=2838522 RepID=UPI0022E1E549|nr:DUF4268 domain-containing protein [Candidatus Collinsella stercoripullorum]
MNAGPQSIVSLLTSANQRMVIPVYQRPYSWDEEQCRQLWEDILAIGRRGSGSHFTGSVVMVLDGEYNLSGVSRLLVIDGQQRITTLTLLLVALAEYARDYPDEVSHFSFDEIMISGYLVSPFKMGEDHYRLTLSQGDEATLRSVVDHLENPDIDVKPDAHRIVENLDLFRSWLRGIEDVNVVWDGIQRLEVVSISLAQGQDNPQLIFESMNSTGKDLSTADLVRNFVLMGLPVDEQKSLYANYWRKIEETLGADGYDQVFDEFLRNWLTVIYAPSPIVSRDVYRLFKRHVFDNGFDRAGRMPDLLKEIRRFANHYACITTGSCDDKEMRSLFGRIASLDVSVVNPLLMSFLEDYNEGDGSLSRDGLISMLRVTETYLFRRVVCDIPTNSLNKFFSSVISRLRAVQDEGGDYREAYLAVLLGEEGTARRMPDDTEFRRALMTRDCYVFRRSFYLLSTLENSYHPKSPVNFANGAYTIEHIMPRNALAHEEWRSMLGADCERVHVEMLNSLGNLTLTAYNSELSDASFAEKKARAIGGFDNEMLVISKGLRDTDVWNEKLIHDRAEKLVARALQVWPMPELPAGMVICRKPTRGDLEASKRPMTFRMICAAGGIKPDETLVSFEAGVPVRARVTHNYSILLENGEEYESPSRAAARAKELKTGARSSINGWKYWHVEGSGRSLADVRTQVLVARGSQMSRFEFRVAFWDGFLDYCAERADFTEVYGDQTKRGEQRGWYVTFGIRVAGCHSTALVARRDGWIGTDLYFTNISLYEKLANKREDVEKMLLESGSELIWNDSNEKSHQLLLRHNVDIGPSNWSELYRWLADSLIKMRAVARLAED